MSLILEALKKLEREKQVPARGVVVLGGAPSPGSREGGRPLLLFLLGLALGGGALAVVLWRQAPATPRPAAALEATPAQAAQPSPVPETGSKAATPSQTLSRPAPPPAATSQPAAVSPASVATTPSPSPSPPFTLQAVSERDGRAVAIINDRLLREGDSIEGARIVRIAKDEVELEIAGRRVVLRF